MIKRVLVGTAVLAIVLCFGWIGCSDDTTRHITSGGDSAESPVDNYFPLSEGFTTFYTITYSDGGSDAEAIEVGKKVPFNSYEAYEWKVTSDDGRSSTSYIVATDSAVYFFENGGSNGELILRLPLYPGHSWSSVDQTDLDRYEEDLQTGSGGDGDFNEDDMTGDGGGGTVLNTPAGKNYPTSGTGQMTVYGTENIILSNGQAFSRAVRVRSDAGNDKANFYWYVSGVGLAKYVLGATDQNPTQGSTVGEIVDYGTK